MKDRRKSERRGAPRRREDRRRPVRVHSAPGERNILEQVSADELLSDMDELELSDEPEAQAGFNPYDTVDADRAQSSVPVRRLKP